MENFVITKVHTLFLSRDREGRRAQYVDRKYACFIITLRGRIRFSYDGGEVIAEEGHPVFLPRGLTYLNECLEEAESYVFNFQTLKSDHRPMQLSPVSERVVGDAYEHIRDRMFSEDFESSLSVFEEMYALAKRLLKGCEGESRVHPVITRATDFMRKYCDRPTLTVGEVAKHCYISEVYLRKLFERELKTSPFRKLTDIRMEKARTLIEEKRPLKEVAADVGYSDVFQFSRAYKRHFGHPPSSKKQKTHAPKRPL